MSDQNPFGAPPAQPYGPPPAQPYGAAPQQYGAVPPQGGPVPAGYAYGYQQPVPPAKSRRTLWIVLGCVAGALLLGGGTLGWFLWDLASRTGTHKVVLPQTFQGVERDDDNPTARTLQSGLADVYSSGSNAWKPTAVAGVYPDQEHGTGVIVAGGYGKVVMPESELRKFLEGFESSGKAQGTTFGPRRTFDPGPLGGYLTCETMKAPEETDSVCVWADNSSVVMVLSGGPDVEPDLDRAAAATRELRAAAEVAK
ncbi:hypothetical protein ACFV4M_12060 [Kitasatospora indigofera]|uniref:hypothetical protein n=1 Tax=Kitasatospora indigofera TaxID=67307 RepID=UPI0036520358